MSDKIVSEDEHGDTKFGGLADYMIPNLKDVKIAHPIDELTLAVQDLSRKVYKTVQLLQQITNGQQEPADDGETYAVTILEDWWTETGAGGGG